MFISNAYAQAANAAPSIGLQDFILPFAMIAIVWLLMFRPQMKKQKEHQQLIKSLQKGDEVVTSSGIVGRISKVGDNYLTVEIASNVEVQIQKGAVSASLPKGSLKNL